jgi:type IV pilus assembly protein PilW
MHSGQRGLSLIEIMVGLVIGLVAILVIGQVMAAFESQKRTSTGGGDAQTNGAQALQMLEQEARMAGFGLTTPGQKGANGNLFCPMGTNIIYDGTVRSNPGTVPAPADGGIVAPVRIQDGGAGDGGDVITIARSDAEFGVLVNTVRTTVNMALVPPVVRVDSGLGYEKVGQLILIGAANGSKICTLAQVSKVTKVGNEWDLELASGGSYPYNAANPAAAFASFAGPTPTTYGAGDKVVNLGYSPPPSATVSNVTAYRPFMYRRYEVRECDGQPMLMMVDPSQVSSPYTCANSENLMDQVVALEAQYGIAAAGTQNVNEWRNATGAWAHDSLTAAQISRIKAVRIAVVSRSAQYIKNDGSCSENPVAGADIVLWDKFGAGDDEPPKFTIPLGADGCQHYRYKTFTTVVPLKNIIWSVLP